MYKERTGGHNRSSTKEKRNTYPPLFSKLRRENALGLIFCMIGNSSTRRKAY